MWRPWSQDEVPSGKLTGGEPRFRAINTWSSPQKNLILTLQYLCKNFRCHVVAIIEVELFHIVTHCYAASFSRKVILCETKNIFYSREYSVWHKDNNKFWKIIKNEHEVTEDSFRNFACVSSYLHSKSFAWKRDYIISQKLQMP